ncbi:uncharacterized protein LOC131709069 isoform X2 [Acipenser ruthenus]|uniref:uncharacterized protein LOC131709069 isoform X2 n=1 Tax=Acipenser ruthenus TaxID=7906 RepID=UPI002741B18A|nr:uncharacterized protein LOC131709069 isoform X2 [Acipenser ruthenus]
MSGINSMSRILLFLIISASYLKHQVQSTAVKEVLPGDNITLNCDIKHDGETFWFVLYPQQAPINIFHNALKLIDNTSSPVYFNGFNEFHSYPLLNRTTWTVNMRIDNVSQQDFALYFCMVRVNGTMKSGNLIKLVLAHNSTSEPKTETNNAPNSTSEPKTETNNGSNCKLCCILLGCVSLLFMVVSSAFVCYFEKRGAKGARTHEEKTKATNSNPVLEEEERDVQYASVDLKKTPKRKKKIKVLQNDVTYAAVKR